MVSCNLRFCSYNCRGFNSVKKQYVMSLLNICDFLLVQEHWLCDEQISSLSSLSSDFLSCGVSGFSSDQILDGRPYGGCAIFWRKELSADVCVLDTGSRRICAVRCTFDSFKLLVINVYMPYEDGDYNTENFLSELTIVENIMEQNLDCLVVCGGDFNVDFSRDWVHTKILHNFCKCVSLHPTVEHSTSTVGYLYNFNMMRFQIVIIFYYLHICIAMLSRLIMFFMIRVTPQIMIQLFFS